ncbi:MAG TPA: hypothetical protein VF603_04605 [Allosphingosinicella sp.]|jgi:hypothetical protein
MLTFSFALALAAAPAPDHQSDVERAVFELCPQAIAGSLSLDDPAQLAAAGYAPAAARQTPAGPMPRAVRGEGTARIEISASRGGESPICGVWFGGPDNRALLRAVRARARSSGYRGGDPVRLGDGTPIQLLRGSGERPLSLTIIEGNAGGGLEFEPVTTIITMTSD